MSRSRTRDSWRSVGGKWTRSLGPHGTRVRLFQKRPGGTFYRAIWLPGRGRDVACLHCTDREVAYELAKQLLANLLSGQQEVATGKLRLGQLWQRFRNESPTFLDNRPSSKRDAEARAATLLAFLGEDTEARSLTAHDQHAFTAQRMAGGIELSGGRVTAPVRARSAESDLVLLHAMLQWATTVRVPGGGRLLDHHPLTGVRRIKEPNPKRPVATWERFQKTRSAIQELAASAGAEAEGARWVRIEMALVMAEATGRRLGSIRQLRWDDIDFTAGTIRWRAEADKKGREWVVPVPQSFLDEVKRFQRRLGVVGGWLFAAEKNPEVPMDRHLFDKWLTIAERAANLPKLEGGLWHPYRRKWATERKRHSLRDVAAAGGWVDVDPSQMLSAAR